MGEGKILSFEMTDTPTSVLISHAEIFDFCCSCCTKYLVYQYMKYVHDCSGARGRRWAEARVRGL